METFGGTQAYLAVPTELANTITTEGYKSRSRPVVPVSFNEDPLEAAKAFGTKFPEVSDVIVLEVCGLDQDLFDMARGCIKQAFVPPENLRWGVCKLRFDHKGAPCPFCQADIPDRADRGMVGLRRYFGGPRPIFMAAPCQMCVPQQADRQRRLEEGGEALLYHQTSAQSVDAIQQSGGKMLRGCQGAVGGGIYFAKLARQTEWKAESRGIVLACQVRLGRQKPIEQHDKRPVPYTFAELVRQGFDSVLVDRGKCNTGAHKGEPAGDEYVVYSWDQVTVLGTVDRDPCQCPECKRKAG